jgi:DNA gyrase inhibitor GyrI
MLRLGEPKIIQRGPYVVVGAYCPFEGEDEGPGWEAADRAFWPRAGEITNRADDLVLGFLYRPHRDDPAVPEGVRACFVGVEVSDARDAPPGMAITRFPGGEYVTVAFEGDSAGEAAEGVGRAIGYLECEWLAANGCVAGDACFAAGEQHAARPPYVEHVYMKIERAQG